jgi:hypothetical protein
MLLEKAPIPARATTILVPVEAWAVAVIFVAKAFVFATVVATYFTQPFNSEWYGNLLVHYHAPEQYGLGTWFTTWDSSHYLLLAEHGYYNGLHLSNAFPPLLPAAIAALTLLTGSSIISGLIIANVTSIATCYLFFAFVRRHLGDANALRALVLFLAFPTAFYLDMIYTESLFILFAVAGFYFLQAGQGARAAVVAFFLPFIRWIGLLFIAPVAVAAGLKFLRSRGVTRLPDGYPASLRSTVACALSVLLAGALYIAAMAVLTGDPLAHVHAAHLYPSRWSLGNVVRPDLLAGDFFTWPLEVHSPLRSFLDRLFFAVYLASAPLVYRKVDLPLFVYYLSIGLVPLLGSFMSYTRYLLPAFPLYIAYADIFARHQKAMMVVVVAMVLVQYLFIGLHVRNIWVA